MPTALIPVAEGSEEIEFSAIFDVLARAGFSVTVAAPEAPANLKLSRGLIIHVERKLEDLKFENFDFVAIPGGMPGAKNLANSAALAEIVKKTKGWIGAICAAPAVVLKPWGILPPSVKATCYPAPQFRQAIAENIENSAVVVSGKIITADGPAHAIEFALAAVREICGAEKSAEVAQGLLF